MNCTHCNGEMELSRASILPREVAYPFFLDGKKVDIVEEKKESYSCMECPHKLTLAAWTKGGW